MKKLRVGVFPSGSQIGIEIARALSQNKMIQLVGLTSVDDSSSIYYDEIINVPFINDPDFNIEEIMQYHVLHYIIPSNELALEALADYSPHPNESIQICGDKLKTYKELGQVLNVPEIFNEDAYPIPAFLKPRKGHSGIGCRILKSMDYVPKSDELILQYLQGDEYTIDCFSVNSHLIYMQPRIRARVLGGVAIKSTASDNSDFDDMAKVISKYLNLNGAWFFQVKYDHQKVPYLLEVGLRIAGSSGLARLQGVNLPLAEIYMREGQTISFKPQKAVKSIYRSLELKAKLPKYRKLYLDLDDTLIIDGKLNHKLMAFIFKYEWKFVYLITRNPEPLEVLRNSYIDLKFFDKLFIVPKDSVKSAVIEEKSIFIDDSFSERMEVQNAIKSVYCMDVSMIDAFI